jgi:16S rRNA (cytosine967-C5)-methyltransferase
VKEKLEYLGIPDFAENMFPFTEEVSAVIDKEAFSHSHLVQPDLFLRIRPGNEQEVRQKLSLAGMTFREISRNCLALSNSTQIEEAIELNKEAVVQDLSSQRVGEFFTIVHGDTHHDGIHVWDCCAGSGGKSIMAFDLDPSIYLTVSDKRESILVNLKKRFHEAGIKKFRSMLIDLEDFHLPGKSFSSAEVSIPGSPFDLVMADVPCTGSGVWGRTPEHLVYFAGNKIGYYSQLQKHIVSGIIQHIKPGGFLLYSTCSVYTAENEAIIEYLTQNTSLQLIKSEYLEGYQKKADTLFAGLLQKPLLS